MSLDDWQRGLHAGLEQDSLPAVRARDRDWFRACHEIICKCVAPDMYDTAMAMLARSMLEAAASPCLPREPAAWGASHAAEPEYIAEQRRKNKAALDRLDAMGPMDPKEPA